jgi:hypothetical protein
LSGAMKNCVDNANDGEESETSETMHRILKNQRCEQREVQSYRCNRRQRVERDSEGSRQVRLDST